MPSSSPYAPDRSLAIATAVLIGGGLLVVAFVYLLTTSAGTLTDRHRTRVKTPVNTQAPSTAPRAPRRSGPVARSAGPPGRERTASPLFGRAPVWAGSGASVPPLQSSAPDLYNLRADMSHADLGTPSNGPSSKMTGTGATRAETGRPSGGAAHAGGAPLTADLGTESSSEQTGWRSDASTLGRRARALSGALARLDRSGRSASERMQAEDKSNPSPGDAATASVNRGPRAPSDPPDPPDDPPQVPVDGGLGWLAAAGAAYAANRLRKQDGAEGSDEEA